MIERGDHVKEIEQLRAEIGRLQAAKRRSLQVADERAKQVVGLRATLKQIHELDSGAGVGRAKDIAWHGLTTQN